MRSGGWIEVPYIGDGLWQYSSPPYEGHGEGWHPLDNLTACQAVNGHLDCSGGGRHWPLQNLESYDEITGLGQHTFAFTTEVHSFFTYTGVRLFLKMFRSVFGEANNAEQQQIDQTFQFTGDDDLWVYINNILAVDVGGLHPQSLSRIDLSDPYVASYLNLTVGEIYSLDLYNAERHTDGSNFEITTSLGFECSILDSGEPAYSWNSETLANDWKLIGGPLSSVVVPSSSGSSAIQLTSQSAMSLASYAFLKQQVNVGTGFILSFTFNASALGSGFVFGLVPQTITNLNGGSGGALGAYYYYLLF